MIRSCTLALTVLALVAVAAGNAVAAPSKTLDNLMAAYNGESNASARYVDFAKRADADGYASVASLFRAAATAESTHAATHAAVIKKLGATPNANVKLPEIKTTADNLKAAVEGETYERDTMYPEFINDATAAGNADAVRTFNFALAAEAEHATLYTDAVKSLPTLKNGQVVLRVRGVREDGAPIDFAKCPVCFTAGEKFVRVS